MNRLRHPASLRVRLLVFLLAAIALTAAVQGLLAYRSALTEADALFDSFVTQAGYSILWTVLALGAMWWAARRGRRPLWLAGAALLGITVAKLFLVDLSNSGGAERIISFIAVGGLMLVLGYFAPLPKAASPASTEAESL